MMFGSAKRFSSFVFSRFTLLLATKNTGFAFWDDNKDIEGREKKKRFILPEELVNDRVILKSLKHP
ncbi:hypothetical protein HanXRQr2_Chr14g0657391 [Helianthus annuus]|uniref:Uncharacterized protein n=1 Tax=Helianthus annuus TaxID=4232 RepID=A0A9K3ED12_HELAN|nr:hypothetical protein HanXRQr2_Chr14g0657391 [Helianthus annuus]KAJ0841429.1 hypothetical protein HanPSC8_Chr14g0630241 [Helianthus annuus]